MGKLIVFEGIDGSGKSTQLELMCHRLGKSDFRRLTFPQYSEKSSTLIKMYLNGEFGENPENINPYAASTFYAVDRYASYVQKWREYYKDGGILLADRYTTSNAIHQGSKLPESERTDFFEWLQDFEYRRIGLPKPDAVIYMDIPLETAMSNIITRETETNVKADIHETNRDYLAKCQRAGASAADYFGWIKINCAENGKMRAAQDIHEDIYKLLFK